MSSYLHYKQDIHNYLTYIHEFLAIFFSLDPMYCIIP